MLLVAKPAHDWLLSQFAVVEGVIRQQPTWGMVVFVALAALSAMIAFLSAATRR
ncbi:hypothetical protein BH24GEM1_BH24GEM1_12690 [soil metagenome]